MRRCVAAGAGCGCPGSRGNETGRTERGRCFQRVYLGSEGNVFQELDQLRALQADYPTADVSPLIEYVEKRIEAMDLAVQSDEALTVKNKDEAIARNDAYNAAEEEAATMAAACQVTRSNWSKMHISQRGRRLSETMPDSARLPVPVMQLYVIIWARKANSVYCNPYMPCCN